MAAGVPFLVAISNPRRYLSARGVGLRVLAGETLHIVADGGGSNSCTARAWKFNLQTSLIHTCDFVNRGIFDFYGAVRVIDQGTQIVIGQAVPPQFINR